VGKAAEVAGAGGVCAIAVVAKALAAMANKLRPTEDTNRERDSMKQTPSHFQKQFEEHF
jgi:hypothetical protein